MDKQAQVTIFVMIGLLLLVIIGLGIFLLGGGYEDPEQTGRIDSTQIVTYVESCLRQTAKDGLLILGRQGGYTDLTGMSYNEELPWLGEAYVGGPQVIPYWYYVKECENPYGCVEFAPPPLCKDPEECDYAGDNSIELQLERYVGSKIDSCLGDFTPLKDRFGIERDGDVRVDVVFTPNDVIVDLLRPLQVEDYQADEQLPLSKFSTRLDIDFEEAYRLAYDIAELQYYTNFVENNFLHFLSIYQGNPPNPPPFTYQEFFGGNKMWLRSDVERTLEAEILPYLNFMQIVNAAESYSPIVYFGDLDAENPYTPFAEGIYLYSEINLGAGKSYPNLGATFLYPYSDIYLNINNRELLKGEKVKADNFAMKLAGLLITTYDFKYDVAWPLITSVHVPDAFGGEGYELSFGLEGNVINNLPYSFDRAIIPGPVSFGNVDVADPQHHTQSTVTVIVNDRMTGESLPEMSLAYECGWSIHAGVTGPDGVWSGTLPYCPIGGLLVAETTPNYYLDSTDHNSDLDGLRYNYALNMWPIQEKEVTILRRTAEDIGNASSACGNPDNCRDWLAWGELLEYSLLLDENGTAVFNETAECPTNTTICSEQELSLPFSQYAMLMLQRQQAPGELDPIPIVNTFTFGKSLESVATQAQFQAETITQLRNDGLLTDEQFTLVTQELQRDTTIAFELEKYRTIKMIPGTYNIQAFLFYTGNIQIPAERRKEGNILSSTTINLPAMNFTTWLQGGVEFRGDKGIIFTPEQVYGPDPLVIYVLEQPLPLSWKMMEEYKDAEEYQEEYSDLALPRFETLPDPLN